jgi:hypothetical protein
MSHGPDYFSEVQSIINEWDPEGLLKMGAPDDEYEDEVRAIISRSRTCKSDEEIAECVAYIFNEFFGSVNYNVQGCIDIARKLRVAMKLI